MTRIVSKSEASAALDDLLESVYETKEPVVIDREGKPVAIVINPADFERYLRLEAEADWRALDALAERNVDKDPDAVFVDVTAEIAALRNERHATQRGE